MKFIALDIGNVCIRIEPRRALTTLGLNEAPPELLRATLDFESGKLGEAEFMFRASAACGARFTEKELRNAFRAILIEPMPGMSELVLSLPARGIQPVFFSDISVSHLAQVREMFPGALAVPEGVYSFDAGALKPGEAMFARFENLYGRPLRYFDDRPELIAAATERGWRAVRFESADRMAAELAAGL